LRCTYKTNNNYKTHKQQAQTFFAGQSRYIGVYDSSVVAAKAFNVVQDILKKYRYKSRANPNKEELAAIFGHARLMAIRATKGQGQQGEANDIGQYPER
jgi:hypothetical protein